MLLLVIGFLMLSNRIAFDRAPTDLNSIELLVTDMYGKAISGAQASALLWDGTWNELTIRHETDGAGRATLAQRAAECLAPFAIPIVGIKLDDQ